MKAGHLLVAVILVAAAMLGTVGAAYGCDGGPDCDAVLIDIKPGSWPNNVNLNGNGVLPVAILSNAIDATTLDPLTARLGPAGRSDPWNTGAQPVSWSFEYVNGDGLIDLVLHFSQSEVLATLGPPPPERGDEYELFLAIQTTDGDLCGGTDWIKIRGRGR